MFKSIMFAGVMLASFACAAPADTENAPPAPAIESASAGTVCGGPSFGNISDAELVARVNEMPDEMRFCAAENGELPAPPAGYSYAEDLTILPMSFWDAR